MFNKCRIITTLVFTALLCSYAAGQVLNEQIKLIANDPIPQSLFGWSIAIDNNIIAVGSRFDDDNGNQSGSVYLYNATTGKQTQKLLPSDGAPADRFGGAIAIADGIVAVSADWNDDHGNQSGSIYLFDLTSGFQLGKITPPDGAAEDQFGISIAIGDGVVAIGDHRDDDNGSSSGSVYLYSATTGIQITKLLADDGTPFDHFGSAVAINAGIVAVGAPHDDEIDLDSGAVYIFDLSTGTQLSKLFPTDGGRLDYFGEAIAISNGIIAIGASQNTHQGIGSGAVYLFDLATGLQTAKLIPTNAQTGIKFGWSVDIENNTVAVGAYRDNDNGFRSGAAYIFDATTGLQTAKLLASDGVENDRLGQSISLNNDIVAVGALYGDSIEIDSGSAYVFTLPQLPCPADLTADGVLNFFDISAFLQAFGENDPVADFDNNTLFNFFDISAFLQAFAAGCP